MNLTKHSLNRAVILTALPLEQDALFPHLSGLREEVHEVGTIYRVGQFEGNHQSWEVITVVAGMHNVNAAVETERVITRFKPDVLLFSGVAGGLKDVAIGDVVAATKVYYYESGKDSQEFQVRAEINESSYALVQRAMAVASEGRWKERVVNGVGISAKHPSALVKPIAAGSKVVASHAAHSFEILRNHFSDAVAVDMESHGFLRASYSHPGILALAVRGISDLIENKSVADAGGGQQRAAAHSAAFAFQILAELTPSLAQARPLEPAMAGSTKIDVIEQLAVALYPLGPVDSQVWSRAGGDLSRITLTGKGQADWHAALRILQNGGGGNSITAATLVEVMKSDFAGNAELKDLL
jgi:nucleoside phosphorylase